MCRFDSTKDWNSSFLPRFRRAMTAISFTVCPENALTLTWIRWFSKHGIRIMICSDHSFSPDNLKKCENRCNKRGIFFFILRDSFSRSWTNLLIEFIQVSNLLKDKAVWLWPQQSLCYWPNLSCGSDRLT